jgi:hypothetical protein
VTTGLFLELSDAAVFMSILRGLLIATLASAQTTGLSARDLRPSEAPEFHYVRSAPDVFSLLRTETQCASSGLSTTQCAAANTAAWDRYFVGSINTSLTLPQGTFPVNTLSIPRSLSLFGAGKESTWLVGYANPVISAVGVDNRLSVTIADLAIDGRHQATGVEYGGGTNSTFRDLKIVNPTWGFTIREATDATVLARIYIDQPQQGGIRVGKFAAPPVVTQSNIDIFLDTIQIVGDYKPGINIPKCRYGLLLYGGLSGFTARALSEARCGTGLFIAEYPGNVDPIVVPEWLTFDLTFMDTNAGPGWDVRQARGLYVTNSWAGYSGDYGMYLSAATNVSISTTKVYNSGNAGISLGSRVLHAKISNNLISANNRLNKCASGIYVAAGAKSVVVESNVITSANQSLAIQTPNYKCGLEVRPGAQVSSSSNSITNHNDLRCEPFANYKSICPQSPPN